MASIGDYLRDFSRGESAGMAAVHAAAFERMGSAPTMREPMFAEVVDTQGLIDDAYRRGRDAQADESAAEHAAAMEAERERHAAEIEVLRAQYEEKQAQAIARNFADLRQDVSRTVCDEVAGALVPFLDEELRGRAIGRLAELVVEAIGGRDVAPVTVSGPRTLFDALVAVAGEGAPEWQFRESDAIDLSIDVEGTVFATRLCEWREALKEQGV